MKSSKVLFLLMLSLILLLFACGDDEPEIEQSAILSAENALTYDFEGNESDFETGNFGQSGLSIIDGRYHVRSLSPRSNHYLVGANNSVALKNVSVEVDALPINGDENNWYGVVCRTHDNDIGFATLISTDGFWAIVQITERNGRQWLDYLSEWQESAAINTDSNNRLLTYCIDDYIALYVNDTFLGDHRDGDYNLVGGVGLLAGGSANDTVEVAFDNIIIHSVHREANPNTPTPAPSATTTPISVPSLGGNNSTE